MDKHKTQNEGSSPESRPGTSIPSHEPLSVQQTQSSMPFLPTTKSLGYKSTAQIVQWLVQVEPGNEDQRSPPTPSSTTPTSQPPTSKAEPVTTSAASVQQATTVPAPSPPEPQFVWKYVRRGAMLGIGGSGGWVPESYVWIRVPAAKTGTVTPAQPEQSRPPSTIQHDSNYPRAPAQTPEQNSPQLAP